MVQNLFLREYLLVLWKHGQPSKYEKPWYVSAIKAYDASEHRDAVRFCECAEGALLGTCCWPGKLLSVAHSGWLGLLRSGLSDSDYYNHQVFPAVPGAEVADSSMPAS